MTITEIERGFEKTIDQFYAQRGVCRYGDREELYFIGGILQAALHIIPTSRYFALKKYIYDKHGYDSGGVADGQLGFEDIILEDEE